jgi:Lrp/AsnC family transcriptional regulator, leucine-responsive regulatory protein
MENVDGQRVDDTDRKIIAILQQDASTPQATIAKHVDLAASSVNERIRKLKSDGVLQSFSIKVDADKFGFPILAFIGVSMADGADTAAFVKSAITQPEILECHHVTGDWNFLLKVRVRSTGNLEELLTQRLKNGGSLVTKTQTLVVLYPHKETSDLPASP